MTAQHLLMVFVGGALGSVSRYMISIGMSRWLGTGFPYGTLTVNVTGSLCMGFLYVLIVERANLSAEWRSLLLIGLLGGLTTFSSFSMETLLLIQDVAWVKAIANTLLNVILCLVAAWIGLLLGRMV